MAHFRTTSPDGVALPFVFESAQSASSNALVSLSFRNKDDDSKQIYKMASIDVYDSGAVSGNSLKDGFGTLAISTASNGEVSEVCRMTDENFVGINTRSPEATLHVVGTARFDASSFVSACAIRAPRTVPVGLATVASSSPEVFHAWSSEGFSNFSVLAKFTSNAGDDPGSSNFGYNVDVLDGGTTVASGSFCNLAWSNCVLETVSSPAEGAILEARAHLRGLGAHVQIASMNIG